MTYHERGHDHAEEEAHDEKSVIHDEPMITHVTS
jgi:hypothetical protein